MKMEHSQQQQQQQQFKIPLTIEDHKKDLLVKKILSTVTGVSLSQGSISMVVGLVIVMLSFLLLKFVPGVQYGVCIGVNIGVCVLVCVLYEISKGLDKVQSAILHKILASGIFGYLWSHQLFFCMQSQLITLTLISVFTSIGAIILTPIQQFTSPTLYSKQLTIHSSLYIRILLPLPLFIIELILDYGRFLPESSNHLYYIRLVLGLVFLLWTFGWISTLYNSYFFLVNNLNKFLFGDQGKANFRTAFLSLVLNAIPIAIYLGWATTQMPAWILWIGSSITSILTFLLTYFIQDKFQNKPFNMRNILMIAFQLLICGGLLALMLCVDFSSLSNSIQIITVIDVSLYIIFKTIKQLSMPRSSLGLAFNITCLNNQYFRAIQRIILRISSGFVVIILNQNLNMLEFWTKLDQTLNFDVDLKFVQYFFIPFMIYRTFKRAITHSTKFGFHLSVLISLGFVFNGYQIEAILVVMFFPPFSYNFLMTLIAPFTTPKKMSHKNQCCYQIAYLLVTCFSLVVFVLSIGMLEFSMFFGLPVFLCVLPTIHQGNKVKSKQHSLYEKIVEYIPQNLFRFQQQGFYLIRISKYIILTEIKQQLYGFGQTIDIKGLQVQQVTSCHSKQGQTIDKLVEQTWGDNAPFLSFSHIPTVLSPLHKSIIHVPTENDIQLTGIIESQEFIQLFKKATLKALIYEISKIKFNEKQLQEGEQIISEIGPICKKEKFDNLFPFEFAKELNVEAQYPSTNPLSINNMQIKKKLPPLKNKKQMVNDFMDLLDTSSPKLQATIKAQTSTHYLNSQQKDQIKQQQTQNKIAQSSKSIKNQQLVACLIMTLYHYSVGKFDYFNVKKIVDLIKMEKGELNQVQFQGADRLLAKSLGMAFKVSVDKSIMADTDVLLEDFLQYERAAFLGLAGSEDFNQAVSADKQDIWTLNYSKGQLSVKRLAKAQNQLYMFKADSCIVKATWNNLRFELMYSTNDNDERYSIQTHPYLMRNLWTQACQQPFGYPSFHSGDLLNT